MIKKLFLLLGTMIFIALVGVVMILINSPSTEDRNASKDDKLQVVTTFYPVYLIGLNVADQIDGIEVKSLTKLNTGCLHDYQLTTEDMKIISDADVLIINGGGMEGFLEDVRTNYPKLTIIDTSQGITMLKNVTEEKAIATEGSAIERNLKLEEYNPHVWLDPKLYIQQIENVRDGLIDYINGTNTYANAYATAMIQQIEYNTKTYSREVSDLDAELVESINKGMLGRAQDTQLPRAVIFHDAFAYLANRIGIEVVFTVPLDSDTALSAGDIATIIDATRDDNIKYLFTEVQYTDSIAKQIEAETDAKVTIIDSVVSGSGDKDAYLKAMRDNIEVIIEALQQ